MRLRHIIAYLKAQNWIAVTLDFVIVVIGVFVGLQVNNWNQARHDAARGQEYLERIHSDLRADVAALDRRLVFWGDVDAYGIAAIDFAETGKLTLERYGALKAACERALDEEMDGRVFHVRAGLILGPHDYDERFRYWLERIARGQ